MLRLSELRFTLNGRGAGALATGAGALGAFTGWAFGVGTLGVDGRLTEREIPEDRTFARASVSGAAMVTRANAPIRATPSVRN
jgi:hypothetical protein